MSRGSRRRWRGRRARGARDGLPGRSVQRPQHRGGPVIQDSVTPALHAALGIDRAPMPPDTTATARRTTPAVFGLGLLDAVPESAILALADPDDANGDGISGRPNRSADGRLGRFGRKAFVPTLREFTAAAFRNEMGITNPALPG